MAGSSPLSALRLCSSTMLGKHVVQVVTEAMWVDCCKLRPHTLHEPEHLGWQPRISTTAGHDSSLFDE